MEADKEIELITNMIIKGIKKVKEEFLWKHDMFIGSGYAISNIIEKANDQEKNNIIQFILNHFIPPQDAYKMSEDEKIKIMNFFNYITDKYETEQNKRLSKGPRLESTEDMLNRLMDSLRRKASYEFNLYRIEQYDFEGNLIREWPEGNRINLDESLRNKLPKILLQLHYDAEEEVDSRDFLIEPLLIASDEIGNIYVTDYDGNKIVKYDSEGKALAMWKIEKENRGGNDDLNLHKGLFVSKDKLYLVSSFFMFFP